MNTSLTEEEGLLRLSNGDVELGIARDFGPRIVEYRLRGGPNILGETPGASVDTPYGPFRPHGGHRLWIAPEEFPRSYVPDDRPVSMHSLSERCIRVSGGVDGVTGIEKQLEIEIDHEGSDVRVTHRLVSHLGSAVPSLAPWALTILAPGGVAIVPAERHFPHPDRLLPARAMVLWHYTDLSDPRYRFGPRFVRLRCNPELPDAQKIGVANHRGWAGYVLGTLAFVKRFEHRDGATYPDLGSNCEIFTRGSFVEVESLGPLQTLESGGVVEHEEHWSLQDIENLSADLPDDALASALAGVIDSA